MPGKECDRAVRCEGDQCMHARCMLPATHESDTYKKIDTFSRYGGSIGGLLLPFIGAVFQLVRSDPFSTANALLDRTDVYWIGTIILVILLIITILISRKSYSSVGDYVKAGVSVSTVVISIAIGGQLGVV